MSSAALGLVVLRAVPEELLQLRDRAEYVLPPPSRDFLCLARRSHPYTLFACTRFIEVSATVDDIFRSARRFSSDMLIITIMNDEGHSGKRNKLILLAGECYGGQARTGRGAETARQIAGHHALQAGGNSEDGGERREGSGLSF